MVSSREEPESLFIDLGPGSVLEDKYRLEEPIEGHDRLWRAFHIRLKKPVAVKLPKVGARDPERQAQRFLREARLAAAVTHPCVVRIADFGSASPVQPYMVMDLLAGESLADRYKREPELSTDEVLSILERVLSGLSAIHDAGIVHRDVHPGNVFLTETPAGMVPKLTDFGASRVPRQSGSESQRRSVLTTREGALVGTPEYMSPEQARGIADVDHRSDVFAMGVVMYEALTGRRPFDADAAGDLIIMIVTIDPPPASRMGVGPGLSAVIDRAMRKDPQDRFQTASEMRAAIRALM